MYIIGPLYLVAIADTGESPQQLSLQLNYVHAQIIRFKYFFVFYFFVEFFYFFLKKKWLYFQSF